MTKDNNGINHTDSQEHRSLVDSMAPFLDNGKPKLGIFWYDVANQSLFGVEKMDAEQATFVNGRATIGKLHKTYWQKPVSTTAPRPRATPAPSSIRSTTTRSFPVAAFSLTRRPTASTSALAAGYTTVWPVTKWMPKSCTNCWRTSSTYPWTSSS